MDDVSTSEAGAATGADIRLQLGTRTSICFVSGNFNVLHPGHLRLLQFAAELAENLVVGVNPDSTPGVTVPGKDRVQSVQALSLVKHAVLLSGPAVDLIGGLRPAIVVKGAEFEGHDNPEQAVVEAYGGRLIFGSGETQFSSRELLRRELQTSFSTIVKPLDYPKRPRFLVPDLKKDLAKLAGLRVLVVGDTIIDEYVTCDPIGMSQEDPTVVVTPVARTEFVGGAGVVAGHARGLGADVRFFTVLGKDPA